jgi:hypothetical protein
MTRTSLKKRIRRKRAASHNQHNESQKAASSSKIHNPFDARTFFFPKTSLGQLRLHLNSQGAGADPITSDIKKQYHQGKFTRIQHDSERHSLLYGYDNAIIGYRIPAQNSQYNDGILDAIRTLSHSKEVGRSKNKRSYRGDYISRHYCVWAPYASQPFISSQFGEDGGSAIEFMSSTDDLWKRMSHYLEVLFPSAFKDITTHKLPDGMFSLAGAYMGCVVNIQDDESSVETKIHRDVRERPFAPSCLCPVGEYEGGDLVLWELRTVVELRPGDLFFFPDSLIHHFNEAVIGERHSIVAFTQQNMFDYWARSEGQSDKKMKSLRKRKKRV